MRMRLMCLPLVLLIPACGGDNAEDRAERIAAAEQKRVAKAREQVSEAKCDEEVQRVARDEATGIITLCRQAGYDPIWEAQGVWAEDTDYQLYANTGEISPPRDGPSAAVTTRAPRSTAPASRPQEPGYNVVYKVHGSSQGGSITIETPTGTSQQDISIPLTRKSDGGEGLRFNFSRGEFLYLSVQNAHGSGSVECIIEVDGVVVSRSTSQGAYVIATCDAVA